MKVLYLSLEAPFNPDLIATGNQVRCAGIRAELEAAGHEVLCYRPARDDQEDIVKDGKVYGSQKDLEGLIEQEAVAVVIVAYWALLSHLPPVKVPVILDFVAPRLLEAMYQEEGAMTREARAMLELLPRADHFLVGNQRQADMLLSLLLLAGFDCRQSIPITQLPIAVREPRPAKGDCRDGLVLVNAGVDWPWRQSADYLCVVEDYCRRHADCRLHNLSGTYPGSGEKHAGKGLLSYREMQALLAASHLGLELGRRNTEREFSHSFRVVEYLQCGLPVIVNAWLPVASLIRDYDAGWVIERPDQLPAILDDLRQEPSLLQRKAEGVARLCQEKLNYRQACRGLLSYLSAPVKPQRKNMQIFSKAQQAYFPIRHQGRRARLSSFFRRRLRGIFDRRPEGDRTDILMVTRKDLFPTDHGAAVKIIRTAEALSRQGREVYLVTDEAGCYYRFQEGEMSRHAFPWWIRLLSPPRILPLLCLWLKGFPRSNAFLYRPLSDWSYGLRCLYLSGRKAIGAYQAEFPAYVRPCRLARDVFGGRIVLVEHNVEYERLREQIAALSPAAFRRLKAVELEMCAAADAVVTVSERDRGILIADGLEKETVHTIPHGVNLQAFRDAETEDPVTRYELPADRPLLVYHGTYSYPPNLEAMAVMAKEILPRLKARGVEASVLAIGGNPPRQSPHPDIHFVGSVTSLEAVLPAADIAVVPLQEGGGTRMKILDYFAAGVPVVSTSKGIEGIPVEAGKEALVLDDYDAITEAVADLLAHPHKARQLNAHASAFVENLSWDAIAGRYLPLLFNDR